jgi:hypothetical protein
MRPQARERFAEPLARARGFVEVWGNPFDRLRADVFLGAGDPADVRAQVEALQGDDGSFAALPGRNPGGPVRATFDALLLLSGLQVRRAASLERGAAFLASRQAADGSWQEGSGDAGSDDATSCLVAGVLARSIYVRPEVLSAAGDFLAARFDDAGASWPRLAGVCAYFSCVDHDAGDQALQWAGRALERGHRAGDISSLDAARLLLVSDATAMPGAAIDPGDLVVGILGEQADDGGWPGAAGERVAATLDAMEALVRLPS